MIIQVYVNMFVLKKYVCKLYLQENNAAKCRNFLELLSYMAAKDLNIRD